MSETNESGKRKDEGGFSSPPPKKHGAVEQPSPNKVAVSVADFGSSDKSTGVIFFTQSNKRRCYVLPTTKNFVEDIQLRYIKTDTGANLSLFYFEDAAHVIRVLTTFSNKYHAYSIEEFQTVGRTVLALQVKKTALNGKFRLTLMSDILPNANAQLEMDVMNFHLSDEDVHCLMQLYATDPNHNLMPILATNQLDQLNQEFEHIIRHRETAEKVLAEHALSSNAGAAEVGAYVLSSLVAEELTEEIKAGLFTVHPRRVCSLLGQDVIKQCGVIKGTDIEMYVNRGVHRLNAWTWQEFDVFEQFIKTRKYIEGSPLHEAAALNTISNEIEKSGEDAVQEGIVA